MISDTAAPIFSWLNAHPELAGLATFIISAGESVAIIGTIVPGSIMMTAIGALVGAGIIPFWSTMIWAILGAIAGDGISYWIGHYFKERLYNIWPFNRHPQLLQRGQLFFHKYGGMSVFIGRFVGPVRALVPLVAGMMGMKPLKFTIANVTSAIGWAPAYMLPGILLGAASLEIPSEIGTRLILMVFFITLLTILCIWFIKKLFELVKKQIDQMLDATWNRLKRSHTSFLPHLIKHYDDHKPHGQLGLALLFIFVSIIFIYLSIDVWINGPQSFLINNLFFHLFRSLRTASLDNMMLAITFLGDKFVLVPIVIVLFCWFCCKKNWYIAWHVILLGALTAFSIELFKYLIHSPRPWGILYTKNHGSYSYPSGHTTLAFVFYLGLTLFFLKHIKINYQRFFYFLAAILITCIAISRLYFGVHWFTDILGAIILGTALLIFITISYNRKATTPSSLLGTAIVVLLTLLISYSINISYSWNKLKQNYSTMNWATHQINLDAWWQQDNTNIPLFRVNRYGFKSTLFNIQWVGNINRIKEILLKNGWEIPPPTDWMRIIHRIAAVQSNEHLPLISPLYLDKKPVLVLIKHLKNKIIIIRFWQSNITISDLHLPLWLGSVEYGQTTYSFLFKTKYASEIQVKPTILFTQPLSEYEMKEIILHINQTPLINKLLLIKPKNFNRS